MATNLRAIIGKLNHTARGALEGAAGLCLSRTHYGVEIEHFLMKLLDSPGGDFAFILRHFGVDKSRLAAELTRSLDKLKSGNARTPAISPSVLDMLREAWVVGSLDFAGGSIRTGYAILALASVESLSRIVRDVSKEFQKIEPEALRKDFAAIVEQSEEEAEAVAAAAAEASEGGQKARPGSKTPHLDQYTVNLTENAKKGKIDPVLGRDFEIRQVVDILTRRRQNNPILVGEAGVGKTAVVEGFALRIAQGDVPEPLRKVALHTLDLALLQAGAGVKGEFENRLKGLINEVKSSPTPIILFIDEAHTMIGAGGAEGQGDAANLLKPALARGELRTVAATTWSEYKKYFEKDPALARRFQLVKVEEPSEVKCNLMLRGLIPVLEKHHNVRVLDEGLSAAVKLSHRYLPDRQLPDKAVSVLDTACARLALGQNTTPPAIEDCLRTLDDLAVQSRVLEREAALGADHSERLNAIAATRAATEERLAKLKERHEKELGLVNQIREVRASIEQAHEAGAAKGADELRTKLAGLNAELEALQGETPLIRVCVDEHIVGEVVSGWTGIPIGKMVKNEVEIVLKLEEHLGRRVIGQDHALGVIAQRIRTSRAGMDDPVKPVGTFLLVGPSGVGKTETALALSDLLYGGENNVITINMSEFQEAHTVSTLKGSPPGYVGYGEGGVLTEAVRRRPYSVVLLDEVEKAHPDVLELFFQVFDKGVMEDGEGRQIDFKNTIIILTSNAGTDTMAKLTADPETAPAPAGLVKALKPELDKIFKPAFLGRLVISPYYPIRDEAMKKIIVLKLGKIQRRLQETHKLALTYDQALVEEVAKRCTEVESGARNVDNILTNTLLPDVSRQLLTAFAEGNRPSAIHVKIGEDGGFVYESAGQVAAGQAN
ncbi:MAG: type VI secretion system ATPase TssH [Acidobacteriota bacterium]|nr:type VI secretion system ATPase TssH [Acidobacteriota bacterium]